MPERKGGYYPTNYKYQRDNLLRVTVPFNRRTEPELVAKMEEQDSKAGYIKQLVRRDIEREGNAQNESTE